MDDTPQPVNASPEDKPREELAVSLLRDVEIEITLEIGRRRVKVAEFLKLRPGQTLTLARAAGEPLDVLVNGRLFARGEAVVVGDRYGVRITELTSAHEVAP
jgi:flagellar motor switch protein FliN/FliY